MYWIWRYGRRLSLLDTSEHPASSTAAARDSQLLLDTLLPFTSALCVTLALCHVLSLSPRPCALSVYSPCHAGPAHCEQSLSPRPCALCTVPVIQTLHTVYSPCHPGPAHCLQSLSSRPCALFVYSPCHAGPEHILCPIPSRALNTVSVQSLPHGTCALPVYRSSRTCAITLYSPVTRMLPVSPHCATCQPWHFMHLPIRKLTALQTCKFL